LANAKRKLKENPDKLIRALALEVAKRVILRTPVDTGRARGNWNLSVGEPDFDTSKHNAPKGQAPIRRAMARLQGVEYGDEVWLANGLPYINALEHGHSKQAPTGMVKVTMAGVRALAEQIGLKVESGQM
jgi:hypothetical protein